VFGVAGDAVVVDVENASPAPFVVAFVVRCRIRAPRRHR
jgi:hypothetical protein